MLEDDFTHVIRKALRGLEMAPAQAAARAGLENADVLTLLAGQWNEATARRLACVLGLDESALAAHPFYHPPDFNHPAITRLDLPFGGEQVNAWLLDGGEVKILIDTGCDATTLRQAIEQTTAIETIQHILITHDHRDHVGGLGLFEARPDVTRHGPGAGHPWQQIHPGDVLTFGGIQVRTHDLSGHALPALGYEILDLGGTILAMGDACFAGSIGGCPGLQAYQQAHTTLRQTLETLTGETLLLPGHGPATRLDLEKISNPFLASHG